MFFFAKERKVHELFLQYAGADRKLDPPELHGLAVCVGQQLGVDPMAFGDIRNWDGNPMVQGNHENHFRPFPMFVFGLVAYILFPQSYTK